MTGRKCADAVILAGLFILLSAWPVHADAYSHPAFYVSFSSPAGEIYLRTGAGRSGWVSLRQTFIPRG